MNTPNQPDPPTSGDRTDEEHVGHRLLANEVASLLANLNVTVEYEPTLLRTPTAMGSQPCEKPDHD